MVFTTINDVIYENAHKYTTSGGNNNDLNIASTNVQITVTNNNDSLTGMIPPIVEDGAQVLVQNVSSANNLVLLDKNTNSTAVYRLILGQGAGSFTLLPNQAAQFEYLSGNGWNLIRNETNNLYILSGTMARINNTITFSSEYDNGNASGTFNINWNNGNKQKATLVSGTVFTFSGLMGGVCNTTLKLVQDATGSRLVTWPATVLWPSGVAPTLSQSGLARDIATFYYDGTNYYGNTSLAFR